MRVRLLFQLLYSWTRPQVARAGSGVPPFHCPSAWL
nr:MAG TPA: hypothetical protein [Caudoviricetes sp.]